MEIGNEISQKIRSAIKAKLVDLGAYVDDELPDYIMVMVANKKTQDQMTEDLNLFLGRNTVKFTTWLHALLNKLKSVTTGDAPAKPPETKVEEAKEKAPSLPETEKQISDIEDEPAKEPAGEDMDENILTIRADQDDFDEEPPKKVAAPQNIATVSEPKETATVVISAPVAPPEQVFTESKPLMTTTKVVVTPKPAVVKGSPKETNKAATSVKEAVLASLHADKDAPKISVPSQSRPVTKVSPKSKEPTGVIVRPVVTRKRKMLGSVVGSVLHHYEEEEEEYDPLRPMVGRVASAIAVQERKSSVPVSLQANRNLIFKAMNEASDSINRTTRVQEPVVKRLPVAVAPMRSIGRGRGGVRLSGNQQYEPPRNRPVKLARRTPGPVQSIEAMSAASNVRPGDRNIQLFSKSKREEVLHRLKWDAEADDVIQPPKYSIAKETHTTVTNDMRSVEYEVEDSEYLENVRYQPSDTRISQLAEEEVEILETRRVEVKQEKPEASEESPSIEEVVDNDESLDLETLVESGAEESDFTDADEPKQQEQRYVHQQISSTPSHEAPPSPKFVVTLDGVDPSILKKEINFEESMDDGADELDLIASPIYSTSPRNIVRVKPQVASHQEITVNLNDDMESVTSGGEPPKKSKPGVRCKFWPACKNGESCPFHHPSTTCKMFPQCKFADKCLFIHPNCKFDAHCTRTNCPFTHASKRGNARQPVQPVVIQPVKVVPVSESAWGGGSHLMGAATSYPMAAGKPPNCRFYPNCTNVNCTYTHPQIDGAQNSGQPTKCRFFPNCTNMNCPFLHPKPCRYGIGCMAKATCPFSHPQLPSKDQLVWSSAGSSIASFQITDT